MLTPLLLVHSLLFSGTLLTRLTAPLCLNFLSMSHLDTHVTDGNQIRQVRDRLKSPRCLVSGREEGFVFSLLFPACCASRPPVTAAVPHPSPQPTAFTQVMGHVEVVDFIKNFYIYYPICIVIVAAATFFQVGSRLMALFGVPSFVHEDDESSVRG